MTPSRTQRLATITVVAFAGPIALATLLACGSGQPTNQEGTAAAATHRAPTALRWKPFQGVDLPVGDEGPHEIDGAVASRFDRSPAGAALAAIQATVRMSLATDSHWARVGQRMLAPGPGRDHWATLRAQISITTVPTSDIPKILGYRITTYGPELAEVEIYSVYPDNSLTCNRTQVLWHDQDWRLLVPDNPRTNPVSSIDLPPAEMVALTPR